MSATQSDYEGHDPIFDTTIRTPSHQGGHITHRLQAGAAPPHQRPQPRADQEDLFASSFQNMQSQLTQNLAQEQNRSGPNQTPGASQIARSQLVPHASQQAQLQMVSQPQASYQPPQQPQVQQFVPQPNQQLYHGPGTHTIPTMQPASKLPINAKWFGSVKSFTGETNSRPQEWLDRITLQIDAMQIPAEFMASVAMSHLEGAASRWGANRLKRLRHNNIIDSWDLFEQDFRDTYLPLNRSIAARCELQALRMGAKQTALEFVHQFEALCADIPEMDSASVISAFIIGLTPVLRAEVVRANPTNMTIETAKRIALSTYTLLHTYGMMSSIPSTTITMLEGPSTTDNSQQLNFAARQKSSSSWTRKPRNNSKCDHCGKPGHTREVCWKLHPHLMPRELRGDSNSSPPSSGSFSSSSKSSSSSSKN